MHHATTLSGDDMIVLTRAEYEALSNENTADVIAYDEAKRSASSLAITAEDLSAIIAGDLHPLTAWRKAAGLTQAQLAASSGVRAATISDIESSNIDPRISTMKSLSDELGVDVDDITQ